MFRIFLGKGGGGSEANDFGQRRGKGLMVEACDKREEDPGRGSKASGGRALATGA